MQGDQQQQHQTSDSLWQAHRQRQGWQAAALEAMVLLFAIIIMEAE
ncbi:MAG: hypothetical protein AAGB97_06685 [Dehalococcoidia bacterium]